MDAQPTQTSLTKTEARAGRGMVATKDALATQAGIEVLEAGGNAVDAAVAACLAVGVVEPMSSGIGGGGYLVYQMGGQGGVIGFPMRGPLAAKPEMYELTGEPSVGTFGWAAVADDENLEGYRSIATPGAVAGLCEAHRRLGSLPLRDVVLPAMRLARNGFVPGWYTLYALGLSAGKLLRNAELRRIFMPEGELPTGDPVNQRKLVQPDLAEVLKAIGREGPAAFYRGDVAEAITTDIQENGGILSMDDLARYRPFVWERGLELSYRGYRVRVPPYACAGTTSAMTLKLLNGFDVEEMGHNSVEMLHAYVSCARLAYADRYAYLADPEFVDVPWSALVSDDYAQRRRDTIGETARSVFEPGDPWVEEGRRPKAVLPPSQPAFDDGTTHLCVMDGEGNAVSLTNTLMSGFGSGVVPRGTGVVMNNGMMWFDPVPGRVNSIAPGKRPLNNMTPALVIGDDGVKMAVGASGGRRITNCVTQLIVKALDFDMGPQAAVDSPRVDCSMPFTIVDPRLDEDVRKALEGRGHRLRVAGESLAQTGFASPVAIVKAGDGDLRAGVDTLHSAHAAGL